jgi:hypothetical protein
MCIGLYEVNMIEQLVRLSNPYVLPRSFQIMTRTAFLRALEEILGVPRGVLCDSDTRDTVEGWSSLADVQIFNLVASELGQEPDDEVLYADSVGELVGVLDRRHAFPD